MVSRLPALPLLVLLLCACAPRPTNPTPPTWEQPLYEAFYDPDVIQDIELTIAQSDLDAMHAALPELIYVPATFTWRDTVLENVGVRYKGNSSSSPNATHKRSWLIKFGELEDGQRFGPLRRVALDNAVQFGSLFSERITGDVLRDLGVTVSRSNYARLSVNGDFRGVYVNVERIDRSFLNRYFEDADGPLFKVHEGGPGADLGLLPDPDDYGQAFEPKTDDADAGFADLQEFARFLAEAPDADFDSALAARFDSEPFMDLMAVMCFSGSFDQYTGFNPHNYYLYREPDSGRWHYLVWDLDVGFADNAFGQVAVIDDWNAGRPVPRRPRPLTERILDDATLRARYLERADHILETWFRPEQIADRLDALYAQIEEPLADDPYGPGRITVPSDTDWDSVLDSMKAFAQRRYDSARAEIDDPPDGPPPEEGPAPGAPGPDDPSDLRVTAATPGAVGLAWTDNSDREGAHIVQRCEGPGCTDFNNHIGFPQPDVTTATDPAAQKGRSYRYRVYVMYGTPQGPQGSGPSNEVEVEVR